MRPTDQDFDHGELITLAAACKFLPRRRRGARPHPSTLWRWSRVGLNGITLRVVKVGSTACTTKQWLADFFTALAAGAPESPTPPPSRTDLARHRRAEKKLDAAGI